MASPKAPLSDVADDVVVTLIGHADPDLRASLERQRAVLHALDLSTEHFSPEDFLTGQVARALGL